MLNLWNLWLPVLQGSTHKRRMNTGDEEPVEPVEPFFDYKKKYRMEKKIPLCEIFLAEVGKKVCEVRQVRPSRCGNGVWPVEPS